MTDGDSALRRLPQIQRLIELPAARALSDEFGREPVVEALRDAIAGVRVQIRSGASDSVPDADQLLARSAERLTARQRPGLRRAINATGIVLHTNLGRAPIAREAVEAVQQVAAGYCNLEFDLATGERGTRTQSLEPMLQELVGAEAALAVNNGAAAILLALSALAQGGEVVVSRGELVEIGGGFRVPDVIRQGGARLVEIGSTNKTRVADYRAAIGPDTRVLLKVHQSNFRMIGFTEEAEISELAALAQQHQLALVVDLGSGSLGDVRPTSEPTLAQALAAGAHIVTCSGDKLLGGPQAGLILGIRSLVDQIRHHPLLRAVRLDKMTLAALEATVRLHRDAPERIPVRRMLAQSEEGLASRAEQLRSMIKTGTVERTEAFAGGGSLPEQCIASWGLVLDPPGGVEAAAACLRSGFPAVIGRIHKGRLLLDMLTIGDDELPDLASALERALR